MNAEVEWRNKNIIQGTMASLFIEERVEAVEAELSINRQPRQGTEIIFRWIEPLHQD
jgi:hypothetical protein